MISAQLDMKCYNPKLTLNPTLINPNPTNQIKALKRTAVLDCTCHQTCGMIGHTLLFFFFIKVSAYSSGPQIA